MIKILVIDTSENRKQTLTALTGNGYAIAPALNIDDARSRCIPKCSYNLILIESTGFGEKATRLFEDIERITPQQKVLLFNKDWTREQLQREVQTKLGE